MMNPPLAVLYEDNHLLVLDKPAGLPVHPTARYAAHTFTAAAKIRFPGRKIDPAHRIVLDRNPWNNALRTAEYVGPSAARKARVYGLHLLEILLSSLWAIL